MSKLVLAAVFACIALAQSQPPAPTPPKTAEPQQQHAASKTGKSSPEQSDSQKSSSLVNGVQRNQPTDKDGNTRDTSEDPSPTDWITRLTAVIAAAAVAQVIVYVFQTNYIKRTLQETAKAADAATASAQFVINSERAWVLFEQLKGRPGDMVAISFKNHGRTPAWFTEVRAHFVFSDPEVKNIEWDKLQMFPYKQVIVSGESTAEFRLPLDMNRLVQPEIWPPGDSVVYGMIRYRDIFGQQRETTFCYAYHLLSDGSGTGEWKQSGPPEANQNT
jgi:hypothetical protein